LLRHFRDDESWHRLIRRTDLLDGDDEPLIVRLAGKLETSPGRQDDIERYLGMPREQIIGLDLPPTVAERALEWVPGYLAVHTTYQAARGYRVENSEVVLAFFDGVSTATFFGKSVGQAIKTVGRQIPTAAIRDLEAKAIQELGAKQRLQAAETLLHRLPGVLHSMTRELPMRLPALEITSVMRSSAGIMKKLGSRTWGKLDRRIIMRRDRKVIIDLSDPKIILQVGGKIREEILVKLREKAIKTLTWEVVAREVGVLTPCLMEQVDPGFRIGPFELRQPSPAEPSLTTPGSVGPRESFWRLTDHPAFTATGSTLIVACLVLAIPRTREKIARRLGLSLMGMLDKARRFEE
jgi:hypothetical protein